MTKPHSLLLAAGIFFSGLGGAISLSQGEMSAAVAALGAGFIGIGALCRR